MRRIVIVFFDAGGGHRAAAKALAEAMRRKSRSWHIEVLNLDDVLEPIDPLFQATGKRGGELYNWTLRRGWTAGSAQIIPIMHGLIRLLHSRQVTLLRECWRRLKPDMVVSVIPHFNRALYESLRVEWPDTAFVTVMTDIADYPPHFWFEPQDQHFICGSEVAVRQVGSMNGHKGRIWHVSGMIVHPRFYESMHGDRSAQRTLLGLNPALPTGLVLFGGYGAECMIDIAARINKAKKPIQMIFLCGRNDDLMQRLRAMKLGFPAHVQGFTDKVAHFMWLSDFFVGKPGPGSVSEALAMRLPVIVVAGARTLAQERYNVEWIRQNGVGIPVGQIKQITTAIDELLQPATYRNVRQRIERLRNRAVFEVPEILDQILEERSMTCPAVPPMPTNAAIPLA